MANSNNQLPANHLTTPLACINRVFQQLQVVYPGVDFSVWRSVKGGRTGAPNEGNGEFECVVGDIHHTTLVEELKTGAVDALNEDNGWFRSTTKDPVSVLLAIASLGINEDLCKDQDDSGPVISLDETSSRQSYFLCISRKETTTRLDFKLLDAKDFALLNITIDQLRQYITLYSLMVYARQNLKKFRHDLRTPLTSVSMIGGLLMGELPLDADELPEFAQMLFTAVQKMDVLLTAFKMESDDSYN